MTAGAGAWARAEASEAFVPRSRDEIAKKVAEDIPDCSYVNLGIGIPTLVANHIKPNREVIFHSENGLLGVGPAPPAGMEDEELINAGKQPVTLRPGGCIMSHAGSFALIKGGRLDLAVLGAYEVSAHGDLANWSVPGARVPAVGGAMDLALGARQVWVTMKHTGPEGEPKLVEQCIYPLTARGVVDRVYTDLAVLKVMARYFEVLDMVPGLSAAMLQERTGA